MRTYRFASSLVLGAVLAFADGCGGNGAVITDEVDDSAVDTAVDPGSDSAVDTALDTSEPPLDSAEQDTDVTDALDSSPDDTGSLDTGSLDTGSLDTGALDTGSVDTGVVDTGAPDVLTCSATQKICGATCVSKNNPTFGCADEGTCGACPGDAHGDAICKTDGTCGKNCDFGYHLCGATCVSTGPTSCGASCTVCAVPANATATCFSGSCGFSCQGSYANCNNDASDGCEKNLSNDPNNCGVCGHSCAGDACIAGRCETKILAVGQNDPSDLALDATHLFWSNTGAGEIVKVGKAGGTASVVASGQERPAGLALDDQYVYWANNWTPGSIARRLKSGAGLIETVASSQYYAYRMVLAGPTLYFIGDSTGGYLRSVPKAGGSVDNMQTASSPKGLVFDGTKLFWTHFGEIRKADPIPFAPPTKLSNAEGFPMALTADETHVYWVDAYDRAVRKVAKTGGTVTNLATIASSSQVGAIAVDATHVFFIDPKANTVRKVAKTGGGAVTIANANDPRGLTIDATYVYWANGGDGTIMRVAK